jgi:hypothetical protein
MGHRARRLRFRADGSDQQGTAMKRTQIGLVLLDFLLIASLAGLLVAFYR